MKKNSTGQILSDCVKCGRCLSVCPVYKEYADEVYSSRGRISLISLLIEDSSFNPDRLRDSVDKCLLCLRCRGVCEKEVDYLDLISIIRSENISREFKDTIISRSILHMNMITKLSRLLPESIFKLFTHEFSDNTFFYLKIFNTPISRILPNYYKKPAYTGEEMGYKTEEPDKYLYFPGCGSNILFPEIAKDTMTLLKNLDIAHIIPENLSCCAFPLYYNGFEKKADEIKKRNLNVFENTSFDKIITTCPTCRTSLIQWYGLEESEVMDISSVLVNYQHLLRKKESTEEITYHQPCHFSGKHPVKTPQILLNSVTDKMHISDTCCGGGGSFFIKSNKLSLSLLKKTVKTCRDDQSAVVSSCPLCMLRIADGIYREKRHNNVIHLSSFLLGKMSREDKNGL